MSKKAVVAGLICLDVIPEIDHHIDLQPGRLYEVGKAMMVTGGAVSNTGLALHILGQPVLLMGKLGDDSFGQSILSIVQEYGPELKQGFKICPGENSSYSMVINIPGVDRMFLHSPGANATFTADDINYAALSDVSLFHFGYSSLMAGFYANGGQQLLEMFKKVKDQDVTTSLDPAMPDDKGPAGKVDWPAVMTKLLPLVDIFMPSADELLYLLEKTNYGQGDELSPAEVSRLGGKMLSLGVAIAAIKLGKRGMYIRTAGRERLEKMGRAKPAAVQAWADRELWFPIFQEEKFMGATGSGDTTIAGFLTSLLRNADPETAGTFACAVGACNVESPGALGGIRSWEETQARINRGWAKVRLEIQECGWTETPEHFWRGPNDAANRK